MTQVMDQPRAAESLDMEVDVLLADSRSLRKLSFFNFLRHGEPVQNEKVEWQDDQMPPESADAIASGAGADWDTTTDITDLPVATAQITKLKVGDVLELPTGFEHVVVSAIDETAETIDLHKRGWGGTTATAQGTSSFTFKIIGNAQVDGSDPISDTYYAPTERYNYVQTFEDVLGVGGKQLRSKTSKMSEVARQRSVKLPRLLSQVNYSILNGSREKTGNRATMQGLRDVASNTYNVNGALTVPKFYSALVAMEEAGGNVTAVHASATGVAIIEQLFASYITSGVSDYNAKLTVNKIQILGTTIEIHVDKHMLGTEILFLDYDRLSVHVQSANGNEGSFSSYVLEDNAKQYKEEIAGFYTIKIKQPASSIVRAYGMTG